MRAFIDRRGVWLGVIMIVVITAGVVGYKIWAAFQVWQDLKVELTQRQVPLDVAAVELETFKGAYDLVSGWNFISFPSKPLSVKTAKEVLLDISQSGGYATTISRWDGDRWQEFSFRGNQPYGFDFQISAGEAYFVLSHTPYTWKVTTENIDEDTTNKTIVIKSGWNAVGIGPQVAQDAQQVLEKLQAGGVERAVEIDRWYSGNWDVFVKRLYSQANVREYGKNFPVEAGRGYMIKALENTTLGQETN